MSPLWQGAVVRFMPAVKCCTEDTGQTVPVQNGAAVPICRQVAGPPLLEVASSEPLCPPPSWKKPSMGAGGPHCWAVPLQGDTTPP